MCVGNLTIIGPDNGLSPGLRQAINWTNAGVLLIGHLATKSKDILLLHVSIKKHCIWKCRLGNVGHFVSASMY